MKGKIIVIEGTDSSGKETQTSLIYKRLRREGVKVKRIDFPNYKSGSSYFVKSYLNGDYGKDADSIDPYTTSTFFALDRFDAFKRGIEEFYNSGGIIISDRYTTANMVHQASKIDSLEEKDKYMEWLEEFEYGLLSLPRPDLVIFLDLPTEYSRKLNENRPNKIDGTGTKDIHESNKTHLQKAYSNAKYVAEKYSWTTIQCVEGGDVLEIEEIHLRVLQEINKLIGGGK